MTAVNTFQEFKPPEIYVFDDLKLSDIKTYDEALQIRIDIEDSCVRIEDHILEAELYFEEHGSYRNPDWYRRAKKALRHRKFLVQRLAEYGGKLSRAERQIVHDQRNQRLIAILREHVGEAVFKQAVIKSGEEDEGRISDR